MKTTTTLATGTTLALMTSVAIAGSTPPPIEPEASSSILDSIHLFGTARLRYEYADFNDPRFDYANVLSLRARLGVKTDEIYGFKFLVEGEATGILSDKDRYNPFPGAGNANGRAIIADPESILLNRLQLSYNIKPVDTVITAGRQYIKFADQRFIGAIGWRQNDQTFDAVVLENKSIENLTFTYAYVDQVNRIFGSDAPTESLEYWDGSSHLINLEYKGVEDMTVRGFAYLLDFDNAPKMSSNTYGAEVQGENLTGCNLHYLATAALQTDAGDYPNDYQEYYFRGKVGVKDDAYNYGVGGEIMTVDGVNSFQFPLGTNHAFNGFADAFLNTPGDGLQDYYAWVGTKFLTFNHTLSYHYFMTQRKSTDLGWEVDYVAARKIGEYTKVLFKGAYLDGKGAKFDVLRASAEVNVTF